MLILSKQKDRAAATLLQAPLAAVLLLKAVNSFGICLYP
jgi:hypothetical protein